MGDITKKIRIICFFGVWEKQKICAELSWFSECSHPVTGGNLCNINQNISFLEEYNNGFISFETNVFALKLQVFGGKMQPENEPGVPSDF